MVRIAPFRGLFYNHKKIRDLSKVIAPPYDVISKEEQDKLYRKSPYNFVRLDLNQEPDSYSAVAQLFQEWQAEGIFERDEVPAIYYSPTASLSEAGRRKSVKAFSLLPNYRTSPAATFAPTKRPWRRPKRTGSN